ncbi:MAG: hypothetical protein FJ104_04215, partial [Deltaproteobacteria bacterium]|nr:hypothetical protein [Deltaproteobacteria bacterium]
TSGAQLCTGALAERAFSHALCTCTDASIAGYLRTESFNSNIFAPTVRQGAPVGINDEYLTAGVPDIGGSFTVAGPFGLTLAGAMFAYGDVRIKGNLTWAGYSQIGRDLYLGGQALGAGYMTLGRDWYQPFGTLNLAIFTAGGQFKPGPVTVDPPCACGANDIIDAADIVDHGRTNNDNALINLDPAALTGVIGVRNLTLPCGRYYLDEISGLGVANVTVTGRVALFVDGDILTAGVLTFNLAPGAEIDIFVKGNFVPTGLVTLGNQARPAASRMYIGGNGDVLLTGAGGFVGNVYAPRSFVTITGYGDVYGSIFANDLLVPGFLNIHYDRGVLDSAKDCGPPPPPADGGPPPDTGCNNSCECAGGGVCREGECATNCGSDGDCCSPYVCYPDGTCGPLLY